MRQVSILIAALFCLALVAFQSASADDAKEAKDKGAEWAEGSVWQGTIKSRGPNGEVRTGDVTVVLPVLVTAKL